VSNDVADEQAYVTVLYHRLDDLRRHAAQRLAAALGERTTNRQQLSQRDATSSMYLDRIAQYNAVENGLCFGRLDFGDRPPQHIGRIGIHGTLGTRPDADAIPDGDEPLLVDWRAPAARPFYLATVARPEGVTRRRHIRTAWRGVTGVTEELLDVDADARAGGGVGDTGAAAAASSGDLTSETALLSAVSASRTGQMRDIVETIQAEQDEIIRADRAGILVVEGGPGSGKTAVALHRAAYLLYHHRDTLATRAVLIVGPNSTFLRYIGQVLPGLGETAVVLATAGTLFPGVTATADEPEVVAEIKGRAVMADVVARAVADRERVPDEPWEIHFDRDTITLDPATVARARDQARSTRLPHNPGRRIFVRAMIDALARQTVDRLGADVLGGPNLLTESDLVVIRDDLTETASVRAALDELWPELTPQQLLNDLYADPLALEIAAPELTADERRRLRRDHRDNSGWTVADVSLLDEAAEHLGVDDADERAADEAEARRAKAYAEGVLEILSRDIDDDPEVLMAYDLIDPSRLAERQVDGDGLSVAERAAADRQWAYGHVIVDEAQELSAMAWRTLMRRCPSRSMTLVGDVAQTSATAGTASWGSALAPYVSDRWRRSALTVNYRTPAEIMAVAANVLRGIDPALVVPTSIRTEGTRPWHRPVDDIGAGVREAVDTELARLGDGRLAVLVPPDCLDTVRAALPGAATGDDVDLTAQVVVLTVRQAKGLEFDTVFVVEPSAIVAGSARGVNDLYVAITRATKRLGIVHASPLPAALSAVDEQYGSGGVEVGARVPAGVTPAR
jgi:DNA helicase IV